MSYLAIVLAFSHQVNAGGDFVNHPIVSAYWYLLYATVFGSIGLSRFLLPVWRSYTHSLRVGHVTQETHDTYSVHITGKQLQDFDAKAGQFFNWRFIAKDHLFQAHPFSLSAVPTETSLRFTYKILGDYTKKLHFIKPGTRVILEGPHGSLTLNESTSSTLLFIAGGIGITPLRAMIEALPENRPATLLYSAKTTKDFSFVPEFEKLIGQKNLQVKYYPTKLTGRVTIEDLQLYLRNDPDTTIYLCGPLTMMHDLTKKLKKLNVPNKQIHYEGFTY
jgi:predicted ferric reductase